MPGGGPVGADGGAGVPTTDGGGGATGDGGSGSGGPVDPATAVTVTVLNNGSPVANVHTYFINPDGTLAATVDTGANGVAIANVVTGGSVTVVDSFPPDLQGNPPAHNLRTWIGVKPGDQLKVTEGNGASTPLNVTLKAPTVAQLSNYEVSSTCGSGELGPGATGPVSLGCSSTDLLVIPTRSGFPSTQALYHPNVTLTNGGTVDLTGDSYQPISSVAYSLLNVPSGATRAGVSSSLDSPHGRIEQGDEADFTTVNGTATATISQPIFPGMLNEVETGFQVNGVYFILEIVPASASYSLDVGQILPPDILQPPSYDVANHRAMWTEAATGVTPEISFSSLTVTRAATPISAARTWTWEVIAPYGRDQLSFPVLPADQFAWMPVAGDTVNVVIENSATPISYDMLRALAFQDDQSLRSGRSVTVASSNE